MLAVARLVALSLAFVGVPALLSISPPNGQTRPNGFVVLLKPESVSRRAHHNILAPFLAAANDTTTSLLYEWPEIDAVAGTFSDAALLALRAATGEVLAIEHDTLGGLDAIVTQEDAPWGLQRISQAARMSRSDDRAVNFRYTYEEAAGRGVDIYIIDTGIMLEHKDFGGRARWGKTFGGYQDRDGFGHGTHVGECLAHRVASILKRSPNATAGTAAGTRYGVAKAANLVAVRVMDDKGSGFVSDTIAAVNWAAHQAARLTKKPSVISISLKFDPSDVLDAAVTAVRPSPCLSLPEIEIMVLLGGQSGRTCHSLRGQRERGRLDPVTRARTGGDISVGGTQINDTMASFSNTGSLVDVMAPAQHIVSDYIGGVDSTTVMSGTSMATPHVAGLVAYLISTEGNMSPEDMVKRIKEVAEDGVVSGLPAGTSNELVNNGLRR
ncbi:subtilisin-like protein [Exidia glandulosa HHB12029]|uniref:Subtilisin-like protein n=1 Tax=Exidia glandulosa HHB12029 TaxID=1314781 RepID=A0A165BS10_EXIGL|nr:subtilisin-like protein [Exidia glandulosa HHB12029]